MPPRRPRATAASRARAARISAALEGLLDELPTVESGHTSAGGEATPYRPVPNVPRPAGRRRGIDCPACGNPMELDFERGVEIHRCIGCAGLWLDPGELESMVDDPGPSSADVATLRAGMKDVHVPSGPVRYRKCPRCDAVMERRNFGSHSGVIVDECRVHGVFLDPGEFEAIEAFIKLGGLALERAREVRTAKREAHRAKLDAEHARTLATTTPRRNRRLASWNWSDLFDWMSTFVSTVLLVCDW